jgi:hypothetical protein
MPNSNVLVVVLPVLVGSLLTVLGSLIASLINQRFSDRQQRRQVELQQLATEQRLRDEKAERLRHALGKVIEAAHVIADAVGDQQTPGGPAAADRLETFWSDADQRVVEARSELLLEADGSLVVDLYDKRLRKAFVTYARALRQQKQSDAGAAVSRSRAQVLRASQLLVEAARECLARVEGEELPIEDEAPTVVRMLARAKL